jgi:hypothetical protein
MLVVCAFFVYTNGWMNGTSLTGTPQGCEHEKSISLHGFVDGITVKPPLNLNFLFLNQEMHARHNCIVFINPLACYSAVEPSSVR